LPRAIHLLTDVSTQLLQQTSISYYSTVHVDCLVYLLVYTV